MRPVLTALALCLGLPLLAPAMAQTQAEPHPAPATTPAEPHPVAPATPVAAGPAGYDVELVIFRIASSQGTPEDWAAENASAAPVPAAGEDRGATDATANGRFVRALDSSELQLNDVVARLRAGGVYPLVAHVGWVQNASPWGRKASMSLQQLGIEVPGLTGAVVLERGEFLHLGLALDLAVANPPAGLSAAPGTVFALRDNHRIKLYERNYYDSPAFGVIAQVTPAQRPVKEAAAR